MASDSTCPICESIDNKLVVRIYDWRFGIGQVRSLVSCSRCSCHFLYPMPDPLEDEYPVSYTPWTRTTASGRIVQALRRIRDFATGQQTFDFSKKTYSILLKGALSEKTKLLEVGAGSGNLLDYCRSIGYQTTGLDISQTALTNIQNRGHSVLEWNELKKKVEEFDFVVLHHVLEHLANPIGCLKTVRKCLKSDGKLIIIVPRIDCWCFYKYGEFYNHLDGGRHVIMYSPTTLVDVLKKSGFDVVHFGTFCKASNIYASWVRSSTKCNSKNILSSNAYTILLWPFAKIISFQGRGEILETVCVRSKD